MAPPRTSLVFLALILAASAQAGQSSLDPAVAIAQAIRERFDAFGRADADAWGRYVADDCLCGPTDKSGIQRELRARPPGVRMWIDEMTGLEVRLRGDVAAVRYRQIEHTQIGEQRIDLPQLKSETYVRRDGRWLLLAGLDSALPIDPPRATVDPARYDALVGRYEYAAGVADVVTRDGARLLVQPTGGPPEELVPEDATTFFLAGQPWRYVFVMEGGRATALRFRMFGRELVARRMPDGTR
jgi:hypothetical protein